MKKFLAFFTATLLLFGGVFYIYWQYIRQSDCVVFVQSFGHGVITTDNTDVSGTDEEYRVRCKNGETLTLKINPERTDSSYYDLKKLVINGENVTDQVSMLEYKTKVTKKMNILVYFKKGERPESYETESVTADVNKPTIDRYADNKYIGSYAAYDVEDPCIFYDGASETYYCFGSDNVVVKSTDMVNWTSRSTYFASPEEADSNTVMDFSAFPSVEKWAKEHGYGSDLAYSDKNEDRTPLSPEIVKVDGMYYLYFSLSKTEDANESAIFCVKTKDLENSLLTKEWEDGGLVISTCGRHAGNEIVTDEDGEKTKRSVTAHYDGANAVHPSILDTDNGLFMVYGGYYGRKEISGELYLVELSRSTGLLKAGSSYNNGETVSTLHGSSSFRTGTLICYPGRIPSLEKTDGSLVSGGDIVYNSDTGYYYLFVTYGTAENNYNVRVARAKVPEGPYLDSTGENLSEYSSSATNNQYTKGLMLTGGYSFLSSSSGGTLYSDIGRASIGSSSVIKTSDGGWFMASQSGLYYKLGSEITTGATLARENELNVQAEPCLEVRELTWSTEGWPMASPEVYAGTPASAKIKKSNLYGNWDVVIFDKGADAKDYNAVARSTSECVTILEKATITRKDISSSRKLGTQGVLTKADGYYTVTIDSVVYSVYPSIQWDWELNKGSIVFTGIGSDGSTIWGKKSFSDTLGIYTDALYYVLEMCDDTVKAKYEKKIAKISSNPSQSDIDTMTGDIVEILTKSEE